MPPDYAHFMAFHMMCFFTLISEVVTHKHSLRVYIAFTIVMLLTGLTTWRLFLFTIATAGQLISRYYYKRRVAQLEIRKKDRLAKNRRKLYNVVQDNHEDEEDSDDDEPRWNVGIGLKEFDDFFFPK